MFILSILFLIVGFVFLLHGYFIVNTGSVSHETLKYLIYFISIFCFGISAILFSLNKLYKFFINASVQKGNSISLYNYDMNNEKINKTGSSSENINATDVSKSKKINTTDVSEPKKKDFWDRLLHLEDYE